LYSFIELLKILYFAGVYPLLSDFFMDDSKIIATDHYAPGIYMK